MSGDYDVQMKGSFNEVIKDVQDNTNWYTDEMEFFNAPYWTEFERVRSQSEGSLQSKLPFVNYTAVEERAREIYPDPNKQPVDLFPRWLSQTSLYNIERTKSTSAFMIAGDSKKERNIGVAPDFPIDVLK